MSLLGSSTVRFTAIWKVDYVEPIHFMQRCSSATSIASRLPVRIVLCPGLRRRLTAVMSVNWKVGDDVIVHPGVSNEEAKTLFPDFTVHKLPSEGVRQRSLKRLVTCTHELAAAIPSHDAPQGLGIPVGVWDARTRDGCACLEPVRLCCQCIEG
jgi:hypothetical protein